MDSNLSTFGIERLNWAEAKKWVQAASPSLSHICEKIAPPDDYWLYLCSYGFGSDISRDNIMYLPSADGSSKAYEKDTAPKEIIEDFEFYKGIQTLPPFLVIKGSVSVSMLAYDGRVIPTATSIPGDMNGFWKVFDPRMEASLWQRVAGTNALFMVPKISEYGGHLRLQKKYGIDQGAPKRIQDHFTVFKLLSQSIEFGEKWQTKILLFGRKWLKHFEDTEWSAFYFYSLKGAFIGANNRYARDIYVWQAMFSYIQQKKNMKALHHLHALAMHLFAMSSGVMPGFQAAQNDLLGPVRRLQEIYIEDYGLKDYAPIIMAPAHFDLEKENVSPVYYSLQLPTIVSLFVPTSQQTTIITDLYHLSTLMKRYLREILDINGPFCQNNTRIAKIANEIDFNFFHNSKKGYSPIQTSKNISEQDPSFMEKWLQSNNNEFPKNCTFFNGCIRIDKKESVNSTP